MAATSPGMTPSPITRPSHSSPLSALAPLPNLSPPAVKPTRPQLCIITTLPPGVQRPVPIRHPAIVKSAPLFCRPSTPDHSDHSDHSGHSDHCNVIEWQAELSTIDDPLPVHVEPPPLLPESKHSSKGHKRRLSDKFKHLFSALHIKRDDRIPFIQPDPIRSNENLARRLAPGRPHRSPGTASFLVTRHLAPRPDIPTSAHSSSTAFSTASRPSWAEKRRLYLAPPGAEASHFSNPTTLSSATGSGRSVSSSVVERSPGGRRERLGLEAVSVVAKMRRCGSEPDLRVLRRWK